MYIIPYTVSFTFQKSPHFLRIARFAAIAMYFGIMPNFLMSSAGVPDSPNESCMPMNSTGVGACFGQHLRDRAAEAAVHLMLFHRHHGSDLLCELDDLFFVDRFLILEQFKYNGADLFLPTLARREARYRRDHRSR